MLKGIAALAMVAVLHATAAVADPNPETTALQQRIAAVDTLIERSSAAQRIESSRNIQAVAGRDVARELLAEARTAATAGDEPGAGALLTRASAALFAAAKAAEGGNAEGAPTDEMVGALIDSANAVAGAARRIAVERGESAKHEAALHQIDELLAQARRDRAAGRPAQAHDAAQRAYLSARVITVEMRQSTTLVRSLRFANRAEEYRYELDRLDAHRMILEMVRTERSLDAATAGIVQQALAAAVASRATAERLAAAGDHAAALTELDTATRGLLAAIRRAGLYVPG